jgi:hypothetical protein
VRASSPWIRYGLLFAGAAALSGFTILRGINPHDEGLMLQAAARIVDGQLPYRDFWWNYGPAQPFVLGGLQEVFGPSLLAWRVLRVLLDATVAVLAYAIARRDASEPLALGAWLAVAAAMAFPSIPGPNPPAIALGLAAILLARRSPAGAGALAGAAIAFRLELGLACVAGALIAAIAADGRQAAGRVCGAAAAAALVLLGPFVIAAPGDFWDDTIGFDFGAQSLQRLPLPGAWHGGFDLNDLLDFYFPYVLLGGALLWAIAAARDRPPLRAWAPVPHALAGVVYLLGRADEFHLIPLAAVLPILLATAADRERRARHSLLAWGLVAGLALVALHGLDRKFVQGFRSPSLARIHLDVADGVRADPAEARSLEDVVQYVDSRVPAGRPVFVANPRHDLVRVGNPLLYVLLQRPNPTRYDVMQPGVVTTARVQREMVRDLRSSRPAVVIRWLSPVADQREDNGSGRSSGVHILDRYLASAYRPERRFGYYQVLVRRRV